MRLKFLIFLACLSLISGFANTARADPCPPPSCPDCYTWNGSACVWACGSGNCCSGSCCYATCCNDVCCAAGQICCGGVCCDPVKCCNGEVCCGTGKKCCTDLPGPPYCCDSNQTCCFGSCCASDECCNGLGELWGICAKKCVDNAAPCVWDMPDDYIVKCENFDPTDKSCEEYKIGLICDHRIVYRVGTAKCADCYPNCATTWVEPCAKIFPIRCMNKTVWPNKVCVCKDEDDEPYYSGAAYDCIR